MRAWDDLLIGWEPVSDHLLPARFAGDRKQTITVIVAYSPTNWRRKTRLMLSTP
jgi:hypothetical protein